MAQPFDIMFRTNHADGCYLKEAVIEVRRCLRSDFLYTGLFTRSEKNFFIASYFQAFQAQTENGSFEHPLFLQFVYG